MIGKQKENYTFNIFQSESNNNKGVQSIRQFKSVLNCNLPSTCTCTAINKLTFSFSRADISPYSPEGVSGAD